MMQLLARAGRYLVAALLPLAMGTATADVFIGTMGADPVVLEVETSRNPAGRYFHREQRVDIPLWRHSPGAMHLTEAPAPGADGPKLILQANADGSLSGERNQGGKTWSVRLQPARVAPPAANGPRYLRELWQRDPYDYLRLQGLQLQPLQGQTFMGYRLLWWLEPRSGVRMFQLDGDGAGAVAARVNPVLVGAMWQQVSDYFHCLSGAGQAARFESTLNPTLITAEYFSASRIVHYDCGGAHPDFADQSINLYTRTGRPLALENLLPAAGKPGFPAWLVRQFSALYPERMRHPANESPCDYADPRVWEAVQWHLLPAGVFIRPAFARVQRHCELADDWSVLPWSLLRGED